MHIKLLIHIAYSMMQARLRQTIVAAVGVTFSITMFIALLGFMHGLNDMLDGLILNRTPHVKLYNEIKATEKQPASLATPLIHDYHMIASVKPGTGRKQIANATAVIDALKHDPRVLGIAPKVTTQVFYNVGTTDLTGAINGIEVVEENRLFHFSTYVTAGNFMDLKVVPNSIILGKGAADLMLTKVGDMIQVTSAKGQRVQLKVVGFFQSGIQDYDKVQSYTSLATAQKLMGESATYITDIQIRLHELDKAPGLAKEYARIFDTDAEDIQTANAQFETGTNVRTLISYAVGITLLVVAGFGIYNILNMMIYEKMDSIAILKATGFSGFDVNRIFILIALSIGLIGGFAGLVFGFSTCLLIDQIPFVTPALPTIKTFPVNYDTKFYVIAIVFSTATTFFAGYFPARKASKIDPVVIIRGK